MEYCDSVVTQYDASIPKRELSRLEESVQSAALRTLQQYFLGEMDFDDRPAQTVHRPDDDETDQPVELPA